MPKTQTTKKHYSPQEAADRCGLGYRTILRYIHNGKLRCQKISPKVWRVNGQDVDELAEVLNG